MQAPDINKIIADLRGLDPKSIGIWPLPARVAALVALFLVVNGLGYYFAITDQRTTLAQLGDKEASLKTEFEGKAAQAANLDIYQRQLDDMQKSFGTMLRQLPGRTEIPSILQDLSQTAQVNGLKQELFRPDPEVAKDFYAEEPIELQLEGNYQQFGKFVSDVSALPRIVTLHNINIKPSSGDNTGNTLTMTLTAKTYRYLEENEQSSKPTKKGGAS
jgi:type IV pilus assembly protein PilO